MNFTDFCTKSKNWEKAFIIVVPGGYFKGFTMKNVYLIGTLEEALAFKTLGAANILKQDIGKDAIITAVNNVDNIIKIAMKHTELNKFIENGN